MQRILIFAGTTEGRRLAEFLSDFKTEILVSTATEYGKLCIGELKNVRILTGRLNEEEMMSLIREQKVELVIDATHPYATEVTENIRNACRKTKVQYLRCLREAGEMPDGQDDFMVWVDSVEQAAEYLKMTEGNILIATGSKELGKYTLIPGFTERCYARVLSTREAVEQSVRLGLQGKHLIAMQGPFSRDMNIAMLRHVQAKYFVTKESGKTGGFGEKAEAARAAGVTLVVIGRPVEEGMSFSEICSWLRKRM